MYSLPTSRRGRALGVRNDTRHTVSILVLLDVDKHLRSNIRTIPQIRATLADGRDIPAEVLLSNPHRHRYCLFEAHLELRGIPTQLLAFSYSHS